MTILRNLRLRFAAWMDEPSQAARDEAARLRAEHMAMVRALCDVGATWQLREGRKVLLANKLQVVERCILSGAAKMSFMDEQEQADYSDCLEVLDLELQKRGEDV